MSLTCGRNRQCESDTQVEVGTSQQCCHQMPADAVSMFRTLSKERLFFPPVFFLSFTPAIDFFFDDLVNFGG